MEMLDIILPSLPHLTRLHVINCTKVDHTAMLRVISHTPNLESLAFTSYVSLSNRIYACIYRHLTYFAAN